MIDIQNDDKLQVLGERLRDPDNSIAADLLKSASVSDDFSDLVNEAFADQENRRFPIFSPEYTAMSALHMQVQDVDPLVKEACDKALSDWGIHGISTDTIVDSENQGIPLDRFLIPTKHKLPVIDEASLEKSASALKGIFGQLKLPEKLKAAEKLYKFATSEFGMSPDDLDEDILRYSLNASCDLNKLANSISDRYAETHSLEYKNILHKVASLKDDVGGAISFDKDLNSGIALELYRADQEAEVTDIFDAIHDTFNTVGLESEDMTKIASPGLNMVEVGGYSIIEDNLLKISSADAEAAMTGLSSKIFENGEISMDRIEKLSNDLSVSAVSDIGRVLSGL